MTVGQRIAQKRKELGLSQEALGEQLGLSRQAVYKWESDAALPEIDKLIALSRTFSVSVGWLLGVEEAPDVVPAGEGDLSEAQLAMVQEIVDRYLAARAPERKRPWPAYALAATILLGVIIVFAVLSARLNTVSHNYDALYQSVNYIDTSVSRQIGSITDRVEQILKSQNDLVADYTVELDYVDLKTNTAYFYAGVVPKTYVEGMTAVFAVDNGVNGTIRSAPKEMNDAGRFDGTSLETRLSDHITISVTFINGDQRQTQKLETFDGLLSATFPQVYVIGALGFPTGTETTVRPDNNYVHLLVEDSSDVYSRYDDLPRASIDKLRVGLFRDKKLVEFLLPQELEGGPETCYICPEVLTIDKSASYCVAAIVTDEYGRERICPGPVMQYDKARDLWVSQAVYEYGSGADTDTSDWEY